MIESAFSRAGTSGEAKRFRRAPMEFRKWVSIGFPTLCLRYIRAATMETHSSAPCKEVPPRPDGIQEMGVHRGAAE